MIKKIPKKILIPGIIIVVVIIVVIFSRQKETIPEYSSVVVSQQELRQTVNETGTVTAETELFYGWELSGRIVAVEKKVGDVVTEGDVIARLDGTQQQSRLREAQSRLAATNAILQLKITGPSDAEKAQSAAAVAQAAASFDQSKIDLEKVRISASSDIQNAEIALLDAEAAFNNADNQNVEDVSAAYEDALQEANSAVISALSAMATISNIQHSYDSLINNSSISLSLAGRKSEAVYALVGLSNGGKAKSEDIVNAQGGVRKMVNQLLLQQDPAPASIDLALQETQRMLDYIKLTLDELLVGLNSVSGASATDKASVNTERSTITAELISIVNARQVIVQAGLSKQTSKDSYYFAYQKAIQLLENTKKQAEQNIAAAEVTVRIREAAFNQAKAASDILILPPRGVDVASLRADVAREQASVAQYYQELKKTELTALMPGVISKMDIRVGETVSANESLVGIISDTLSIEVDISESDVAKLMVQDPVEITLDAFGDDVTFTGKVIAIDPAQTEISGVIYYKTDILFDALTTEDIRPGMTANIEILTDAIAEAIVIPQRAILEKDGKKIVRVLQKQKNQLYEEREIQTGIRGNDGFIEVVSGLSVGEEVITFIKEAAS